MEDKTKENQTGCQGCLFELGKLLLFFVALGVCALCGMVACYYVLGPGAFEMFRFGEPWETLFLFFVVIPCALISFFGFGAILCIIETEEKKDKAEQAKKEREKKRYEKMKRLEEEKKKHDAQ